MINDEERRKVAARLRNQLTYMRENGEYYKNDLDLVECGNSAYRNIADSVEKYSNNFTGYYIPIVEKLADLIDIPTCVMTNVGGDFENSFQCSNCMNKFDMPDYDRYPYKRCPECGAVVLNAD